MTDVFKIIVKHRREIIAKYRHLSPNGNRALDHKFLMAGGNKRPCTFKQI